MASRVEVTGHRHRPRCRSAAHARVGAAVVAKLKDAGAGVMEREAIWTDRSHLALLTGLDGHPAQARGPYAAAGAHPHWERAG